MAAGDLFWDSVYVAMHMDDAGLTCAKGTPFTLSGGVARSAAQSKFGGYSAYFDGVDDEIRNSADLYALQEYYNSGDFFCRPGAQTSGSPTVLQFRHWRLEYKPTGHPYGFVMNVEGVRTPCGEHAQDTWHYIWFVTTSNALSLYINGQFVAIFETNYYYDGPYFTLGSASLATYPDTAFAGYVDDFRLTKEAIPPIDNSPLRFDFSIPTATFLDRAPDPEGPAAGVVLIAGTGAGLIPPTGSAAGALTLTSTAAGYAAPIGSGAGAVRVTGAGVANIPNGGSAYGRVRLTGLGAGVVGTPGVGAGLLRITGAGVGALGLFGGGAGQVRLAGAGVGYLGVGGVGSGALRITGAGEGVLDLVPVGAGLGALRISGNGYGSGGLLDAHCH